MKFPADFIWGAASSCYQIEGSPSADGKGASIWDTFTRKPGAVYMGHTGEIACDTYHQFETDLDLMAQLGIANYRFSISWPRIMPDGRYPVNEAGLAYYDRLVNACLVRGITPWITLYHWDLPQALEDEGGWLNRETAVAFQDYAALIAEYFRGRVTHYFTLNEPQCATVLGYGTGDHAPGLRLGFRDLFRCHFNLMLAHGMAVSAMRKADPDTKIGIASTGNLCYPASESGKDIVAARQLSFSPWGEDASGQLSNHHWFLDAIVLGKFPQTGNSELLEEAAKVSQTDLNLICQPLDLLGLNIYHGQPAAMTDHGPEIVREKPGSPMTAMKWPVSPEILRWGPQWIWERYHLPMVITENGLSCNDKIYLDGKVHDTDRIDFLSRYLEQLSQGIQNGIPVKGYFHWALTDNFEWSHGYKERFGLIYVDFETQKRILKDSALWYGNLIRPYLKSQIVPSF